MNGPLAELILATATDAGTPPRPCRAGIATAEPVVPALDAASFAARSRETDVVVLDSPSPPVIDSDAAMLARASRRDYDMQPLASSHLAAILEAWDEGAGRMAGTGDASTTLVVARHVAGAEPGIYGADPESPGRLRRLAPLPDGGRLFDTVLQAEFAAAPAILVFAGRLEAATTSSGAHGHRLLHLQAGLAAQAAWLAAERRLLAGCAFAGILPSFLRQAGIADGYRLAAVFAFALGARSA